MYVDYILWNIQELYHDIHETAVFNIFVSKSMKYLTQFELISFFNSKLM